MKKVKVIGITGIFASGKSTVSDMLEAKGAVKIDADRIGHSLLEKNAGVKNELVAVFGAGILSNGKIDRKKLRKIVFNDEKKLSRLNDVMHPAIIREIKKEYESVVDGIVVIDAPLLFETGLADTVDLVVVVAADPETVIKRASSRGFKEEETRGIIDAQMPIEEKKKLADFVIDNNGNRDNTKQGVEKLWKKIQDL